MGAPRPATLLLSALLAAGCAAPGRQVVNPRYRDADFRGRTVRVLPIAGVEVLNPEEIDEALGGEDPRPSAHAASVLTWLFARALEKRARGAALVFDTAWEAAPQLKDTVLEMPGGGDRGAERFAYPPARLFLDRGADPDLALQIQDLEFRHTVQAVPLRFAPFGSPGTPAGAPLPPRTRPLRDGTRRSLDLRGKYVLWDCRAAEPVAYGLFSVYSDFSLRMGRRDWESVAAQAARIIVDNSPLKGRK